MFFRSPSRQMVSTLSGCFKYLRSASSCFIAYRKRLLTLALAFWKGGVPGDASGEPKRLWSLEPLENRQLLSVAPGMVPIGNQPDGALSGKIAYISAGHGWQWSSALGRWATDRPNLLSMVEDFGNQDQLTFYADYLLRAGATVVPMRPVGRQLNEVVLDNDSPEVTWSGSWSNNTTGPRWYDEDYGASTDSIKYRFATVSSSGETATATYAPNLPESGHYPVYAWAYSGSNRTNQLYRINHTGGSTEIRVDHRNVGNGWVYLGTYFFGQGQSTDRGSVQVSNSSTSGGSVVIADAIRFGNGMGDLPWGSGGIGTGNISGYPREDEGSIAWIWRGIGLSTTFSSPSSIVGTSNVSAPLRMASHMNSSTNAYGSSIYVGFHSNATTGDPNTATARGAIGLLHSGSPTPNQLALAVAAGRQINVDMRALDGNFEHDWSTRTSYSLAGSYGEITNSVAAGKFDATIVEVAFHDNTQDAQLMRDPRAREQIGRSTYEATLEHLHNFPGATAQPVNVTVPSAPILHSVISQKSGQVTLNWTAGASSTGGFNGVNGSPATGFRIFASVDGYGFDGGTFVSGGGTQSVSLSGYDPDLPYYFKIVAENSGGQSTPSELLTVLPNGGPASVLIVAGFDRKDRTQNFRQAYAFGGGGVTERVWDRYNNSKDHSVQLHQAIADVRPGLSVSSASNEAVAAGSVNLNDYESVFWILGNESSADQTFNAVEQALVTSFIANGGNLFASGSEIGYELDGLNNGRTFYRDVLGATYVADSASTYQVVSTGGGIFAGLPGLTFSSGSNFSSLVDEMFNVSSADRLSASTGSVVSLQYSGGASGNSAIQKASSGSNGNTVVLGFPFESVVGRQSRADYMDRVLDFFGHPVKPTNSVVVGSHVYHADSFFAGSGLEDALDAGKFLAKEGPMTQTLDYLNLINSSRGLNGIVFDFDGLPGQLTESDFLFQMSPTGAFDTQVNIPSTWAQAPSPQSVAVINGPLDRVVLQWPDNAIANRWLRITVLANSNTGLLEPEVYYIGHLLGETTGAEQGVFTVSFLDIAVVRIIVGATVDSANTADIDKDGLVTFADISSMRGNVGAVLPAVPIPATNGGGGSGTLAYSSEDVGEGRKDSKSIEHEELARRSLAPESFTKMRSASILKTDHLASANNRLIHYRSPNSTGSVPTGDSRKTLSSDRPKLWAELIDHAIQDGPDWT